MTMHAVAANGVGVTTGEHNGERVLKEAVHLTPHVALVGMAEADDVTVTDGRFLGEKWNIIHRGADVEKDGSLLAYDKTRITVTGPPQWTLGVTNHLPGLPAARMQPRWFLRVLAVLDYDTAKERRRVVTVGHFPPPDAPAAYWQHMAQVARMLDPDLLIADFNAHAPRLRRAFPDRKIRVPGGDVMGFVADRPVGARSRSVPIGGSDHNATILAV